jgi:hypothetical protein
MLSLWLFTYLKTAAIFKTSRHIMHKYQVGDRVSFINIFKQPQEGPIQDQVTTGGNNAYTVMGYDFLVLEKQITALLAKAQKKRV